LDNSEYPRDMIGYGANPPSVSWPNNARVAVQFVLNYEEGGENCILHGDESSEAFLSDITGAAPLLGQRNMNIESMYEYGSRAGFWRIHRLFTQRGLPLTVFGVAMAMARNPEAVKAMLQADWEIASHGLRWIDYQNIGLEQERAHMHEAIALHKQLTGQPPKGWYTGRVSENTRSLVQEAEQFLYDSDSYADDLPYWDKSGSKPHLVIPYSLETNDMKFVAAQGFNSGEQFFTYLRDAFDTLYAEGEQSPKMMSIGLHCRIIGKPARIASLMRFLDYIQEHDDVWICKREDIAHHWHEHHPPR
jgi:allantoinase